jgi:hypothetical protein
MNLERGPGYTMHYAKPLLNLRVRPNPPYRAACQALGEASPLSPCLEDDADAGPSSPHKIEPPFDRLPCNPLVSAWPLPASEAVCCRWCPHLFGLRPMQGKRYQKFSASDSVHLRPNTHRPVVKEVGEDIEGPRLPSAPVASADLGTPGGFPLELIWLDPFVGLC